MEDFTIPNKYNKFHDFIILCDGLKFMTHRGILCQLEFFTAYYNNIIINDNNKIISIVFDDIHLKSINPFLNYIYTKKYDLDIIDHITFFDYILYIDLIVSVINLEYKNMSYDQLEIISKYLQDKYDYIDKSCDMSINYNDLYKVCLDKCIIENNYIILKYIDNKYLDIGSTYKDPVIINDQIKYIKYLNYLYNTNPNSNILDNINIHFIFKMLNNHTKIFDFLKTLPSTSSVKNYICIGYIKRNFDHFRFNSRKNGTNPEIQNYEHILPYL